MAGVRKVVASSLDTGASPRTRFAVLTTQAEAVSTRYSDEAESLRTRAENWGKGIAGAMTAAVGWITWSKATDLYPHGETPAFLWAIVSICAMGFSVLLVWW